MMKTMMIGGVLALGASQAWAAVTPVPNLVVNGSFEQAGSFALPGAGSWGVYGDGALKGWRTSTGYGVEIQNGAVGRAQDGSNLVELDSDSVNYRGATAAKAGGFNSNLFQDLATVAGQTYRYSFWYAGRPGVAADSTGIDYTFGSVTKNVALAGGSSLAWTQISGQFTASGSTSRILFAATGKADRYGGFIDNVVVNAVPAVPEPETWALMGLGLGGALLARRRRRA